jgi:vacuolar-type H+-ATPase subunit E/Vma4
MTTRTRSAPAGTVPRAPTPDPLAVVRAALLARARSDAKRIVQAADDEVADQLVDAAARAAETVAAAAAATQRDADAIADEAGSRARRQARAIVLAARQSTFEELRSRSHDAVHALRTDAGYPALVARLTTTARERLGSAAVVREQPEGGVVAEADGRRLTLTLDAAADRALDALGFRVEELWGP